MPPQPQKTSEERIESWLCATTPTKTATTRQKLTQQWSRSTQPTSNLQNNSLHRPPRPRLLQPKHAGRAGKVPDIRRKEAKQLQRNRQPNDHAANPSWKNWRKTSQMSSSLS